MPEYEAHVTPVELLASIPARTNNQPAVVLVFRVRPNLTFVPTHLSVSKAQAERLRDDLTAILERDNSVWSS